MRPLNVCIGIHILSCLNVLLLIQAAAEKKYGT